MGQGLYGRKSRILGFQPKLAARISVCFRLLEKARPSADFDPAACDFRAEIASTLSGALWLGRVRLRFPSVQISSRDPKLVSGIPFRQ